MERVAFAHETMVLPTSGKYKALMRRVDSGGDIHGSADRRVMQKVLEPRKSSTFYCG